MRSPWYYAEGILIPKDSNLAEKWFLKSAEKDINRWSDLGNRYADGVDIRQDSEQAIYWLTKVAERGDLSEILALGERYADGCGIPQNSERALFWLTQAAEQGYADAQYSLGIRYLNGTGIPKDIKQSEYWLNAAKQQNHEEAINTIRRLEEQETQRLEKEAEIERLAIEAKETAKRIAEEEERKRIDALKARKRNMIIAAIGLAITVLAFNRYQAHEKEQQIIAEKERIEHEKELAEAEAKRKAKEEERAIQAALDQALAAKQAALKTLSQQTWDNAGLQNHFTEIERQMVTIPSGSFTMGCMPERDGKIGSGCDKDEFPAHEVAISSFRLESIEVTMAMYFVCVNEGKCSKPQWKSIYPEATSKEEQTKNANQDTEILQVNHPVVGVSFGNAKQYIQWINQKTGKSYRLPTEAEWEYAARGKNTVDPYPWGVDASHEHANYGNENVEGQVEGKDQWIYTAPVAQFPANSYGLYDMHGNAIEWVADCYRVKSYESGAPTDESCQKGVIRGGSWISPAKSLRSANRLDHERSDHDLSIGFRLAESIKQPQSFWIDELVR